MPLYVIVLFLLRQLDFFFFLTPSFVLGCRDLLRLRRPCQAHGAPDHHGNRCASQVAARKNNACGVGIAYDSKAVIGSRISITDEATALTYGYDKVGVYSCSWGPRDNGQTMNILSGKLFQKTSTMDDKEKGLYTFSQAAMVEGMKTSATLMTTRVVFTL